MNSVIPPTAAPRLMVQAKAPRRRRTTKQRMALSTQTQLYADLTTWEQTALTTMEAKLGLVAETQGFHPMTHLMFVNVRKQLDIEPRLLMYRLGDHSFGFYRSEENGRMTNQAVIAIIRLS